MAGLILKVRLSNLLQDPWGVWYFSVGQLAALLDVCDIMFADSEDLEDAYHLSIVAGCTGKPSWSRVFTTARSCSSGASESSWAATPSRALASATRP